MNNFDYPAGSDTAAAPWNQPDAFEGEHICDECDRTVDGYALDGTTCGNVTTDEDGEPHTCEGSLQAPEPQEAPHDWD